MKALLAAAFALLPSLPFAAPASLLPAQSEIVFTSKQMGVPVEGRFTRFDARIALDPRAPEAGGSSIALDIDIGSATLGVAEVDAELPKPNWFDAAKFPHATFQSSTVKRLGGGRFEVRGQLEIKGVARELVVPVTIVPLADGIASASGSFAIKRLAFKVGEAEWADPSIVADEVLVRFKLALRGLGPL